MTDPRVRFLSTSADADIDEVVRLLDEPTIRITCAAVDEWRHQVLLYALVDLLGRIFRRLDIDAALATPAAADLPPGEPSVGERLGAVRQRSPLATLAPAEPAMTVHIGPGDTGADLYVDASEWQCYVGRTPSRLSPPRRDTAMGPVAAACRAGAQVYTSLLAPVREAPTVPDQSYMSTLTYRIDVNPLDEPEPPPIGPLDAHLVGGGSVGGAAAYTMSLEPDLSGHLTVCDPECVDETNPYRSVLATASSAALQATKAVELKAVLAHHEALLVDEHVSTVTEWEAGQDGPRALPTMLVAVDSRESRELIQDALPLTVVNAAVGADLVAVSGHQTGNGPCMCCLHMPQVLDAHSVKNRLIADATGIKQEKVNELRVRAAPLDASLLRHIEGHRRLPGGALAHCAGKTLDELYQSEILYGETEVLTDGGARVAVAAPFVTTLAGVLLAGEAFKQSTPALSQHALGPDGPGIQYRENPYLPEHGFLDPHIPRAAVCLCRSARRLRLLAELHGLQLEALTG